MKGRDQDNYGSILVLDWVHYSEVIYKLICLGGSVVVGVVREETPPSKGPGPGRSLLTGKYPKITTSEVIKLLA